MPTQNELEQYVQGVAAELRAELCALREERDALISENLELTNANDELRYELNGLANDNDELRWRVQDLLR